MWDENKHPRDAIGRFKKVGLMDGIGEDEYYISEEEKAKAVKRLNELFDFVERIKQKRPGIKGAIKISEITPKERKRIEELNGECLDAIYHTIDKSAVEHIEKRHGINGLADKTMSKTEDYAKIIDTLQNFDDIRFSYDRTGNVERTFGYFDKRHNPAKSLVYIKNYKNGVQYVVVALSDSKKSHDIKVVTAYKKRA